MIRIRKCICIALFQIPEHTYLYYSVVLYTPEIPVI